MDVEDRQDGKLGSLTRKDTEDSFGVINERHIGRKLITKKIIPILSILYIHVNSPLFLP